MVLRSSKPNRRPRTDSGSLQSHRVRSGVLSQVCASFHFIFALCVLDLPSFDALGFRVTGSGFRAQASGFRVGVKWDIPVRGLGCCSFC